MGNTRGTAELDVTRSTLLRAGIAVMAAGSLGALAGCAGESRSPSGSGSGSGSGTTSTPRSPGVSDTTSPSTSDSSSPPAPSSPTSHPTSVPSFAGQTHRGDRLRLRAVRERGNGWTSHDVTWRVRSTGPSAATEPLGLSGVLTLPDGPGPHPVVVLAHGYIAPSVYLSGQGMTRERQWLGDRGWASLHVDYRGHASSDPDPSDGADVRLGYAVDVIGALDALRHAARVNSLTIDPDRTAVFGRSMGGGVVQKVAEIAPTATSAVVAWASVSSLEPENVRQFMGGGDPRRARLFEAVGSPREEPEFWSGVSPRPHFDRITAPVLLVHGRSDDTCPPRWAEATHAAMQEAGVDVELEWFDEGHTFAVDFRPAMRRTLRFLEQHV